MSLQEKLASLAPRFLRPRNATQRQYEALRAYCVEQLPAAQVAARFGYTTASLRALVHRFRQDPDRPFFLTPAKGPHASPKKDLHRAQVIALRKQNLSIYDISRSLHQAGQPLSPAAVAQILHEEGFAKLPRPPMTNARPALDPRSPTSSSSTSNPAPCTPGSAVCSCSCLCSPNCLLTAWSVRPASPARP